MRILIVDDEPAITESLAYALERGGFEAVAAFNLQGADAALQGGEIDLVVLDLGLPDGRGIDWLRALRARSDLPVIILSSYDDPGDHILGLETGADDYVDKPFSPREMVARVTAVLRRTGAKRGEDREGLSIDLEKRSVSLGGVRLQLSRTEFDLLWALYAFRGRVQKREALIDRVWGPGIAVTERTVDTHIKSLRKKLAQAGGAEDLIETVRGVGYRMTEGDS